MHILPHILRLSGHKRPNQLFWIMPILLVGQKPELVPIDGGADKVWGCVSVCNHTPGTMASSSFAIPPNLKHRIGRYLWRLSLHYNCKRRESAASLSMFAAVSTTRCSDDMTRYCRAKGGVGADTPARQPPRLQPACAAAHGTR